LARRFRTAARVRLTVAGIRASRVSSASRISTGSGLAAVRTPSCASRSVAPGAKLADGRDFGSHTSRPGRDAARAADAGWRECRDGSRTRAAVRNASPTYFAPSVGRSGYGAVKLLQNEASAGFALARKNVRRRRGLLALLTLG